MKILFLVEDEGEEGGLLKKQTNEHSVNGNPDYGKKAAKDIENGKSKIPLWAFVFGSFGFSVVIVFTFYPRKRKMSKKKNKRR